VSTFDRRKALWVAGAAVWITLVVIGVAALMRYSLNPGRQGNPPDVWPAASRLDRSPDRYTLVLAAHPRCPCTRATIAELAVIMKGCAGRVTAHVLFVQPPGVPERWAKTGLWRTVQSIPGATASLDPNGTEAHRFDAFTSGQAVLYDPSGRRVFSGGITGARGEEGPNAGLRAVVARLERNANLTSRTPVYGCPLHALHRIDGKEDHTCPQS